MGQIRLSIEINVPLRAAYNQWTQFEDFPRFMEGVNEVEQKDEAHLHWRADRNGQQVEWDSEIVDQIPDQLISWRDVSGPGNQGSLHFYTVREDQTRIELTMDITQAQSDHQDETRSRIEQDLHRFKQMLEGQGQESGAWRGEIHHSKTTRSAEAERNSDSKSGKL